MYLSFRGIDFFAFWVMELFRQCGIVCFACQMFELFRQCVFFHYTCISLFYIFLSLLYICVYFRIIASSSNFSFHFVVFACDFQFVFTPICFVGFMFYLLFVLFFKYTVFIGVRLLNLPFSVQYFVHHCCSFCPCLFSHCIACRSTVYGF